MSFTAPLPAVRTLAGTSTADPAADVNLLSAALGEVRGRSVRVANLAANGTTDDAAALVTEATAAVAAKVPLVLPAGATIAVGSRVNLPSDLTLIANGAEIRGLSETGDFLVSLGANTTIHGLLRVTTATGVNVRGVGMFNPGGNYRIDALTITAQTAGAGTDALDLGLSIANCANVHIGRLTVTNFDYPVKVGASSSVTLDVDLRTYLRGIYVTDSTDVRVTGHISQTSPNASVSPGHNGVLIDATTHDATSRLRFDGLTVRDAGEHGFRIGGNRRVRDVRFTDCAAINVGGCGFKVLGGTVTDANYHEDIYVTNALVEDAGQTAENAAGIQMEFVRRYKITNPIIRRRNKTYSAGFGVQVQACIEGDTINPTITDTLVAGYAVRHVLGHSTNIKLIGGSITVSVGDCVLLNYTGRTFRRVAVEGHPQLEVAAGTGACVAIVNDSGGAIIGGSWLSWQSVSAAAQQTRGLLPGWHADVRAPFTGNPNFKPGSTWVDPWTDPSAGGVRYARVPGAWQRILDAGTGLVVINHGSNANFPRPEGITAGYWLGTVAPVNMTAADVYNGPDA